MNWVIKSISFRQIRSRKIVRIFLASVAVLVVGLAGVVVMVNSLPSAGAKGADLLRSVLGPKPVAYLEELVFKIQDSVQQIEFRIGGATPAAPWQIAVVSVSPLPEPTFTSLPSLTPTFPNFLTPTALSQQPANGTVAPTTTPTLTQTPSATPWQPEPVRPIGNMTGEGIWQPFIKDPTGALVAYRSFLEPDPERPYVVIAAVAFDLSRIRLHYVLGIDEPYVANSAKRSGTIPKKDLQPSVLLAAFNGGFKSINGNYGVMSDTAVLIEPMLHIGTIAIYRDGSIRIGSWGDDLVYTNDMVTFRQNCPLMVHNGEVNPLVFNNSVNDWGGSVNGETVTFRSGLGISQDGGTLYYFSGQKITMPVLAKTMQYAGAYQAMQLDINNYYVLFTDFQVNNGEMTASPLLPKDMASNLGRFLHPYSRDFFYVTATNYRP